MVTQIILAAGLSSRMKSPKPLLDFAGIPLLELLVKECRHSPVDEILVVLGHEREQIQKQVDLSHTRVVVNSSYRLGQTSSFLCALRLLDPGTEAFLNLPVDHPLVTRKEIAAVIKAYRQQPDRLLVIPRFHRREGRPVLFNISLREELLALGHQDPVNSVIERHRDRAGFAAVDNPYLDKDMDTPEDYQECLRLFLERSRLQPGRRKGTRRSGTDGSPEGS